LRGGGSPLMDVFSIVTPPPVDATRHSQLQLVY
jgi:hypothetical protein